MREAEIIVCLGEVRRKPDDSLPARGGFVEPAGLVADHAQKMQRIDMARFGGENLPIDLLRRLKLAALMVPYSGRQGIGDGGHVMPSNRAKSEANGCS